MHRRSCLLGLFASVSAAATMSLAASIEALAERGSGERVPGVRDSDAFSARRRRFRFSRRRRRRGRGGGGEDSGPTTAGGGGAGGGDSILTTRKPVPLSDQAPPPRPRARE